jgi:hypothetical protein
MEGEASETLLVRATPPVSVRSEEQRLKPAAEAVSCAYDLRKKLALSQTDFDRDTEKGWREVASRPGCEIAAAELIKIFREHNGSNAKILVWHEGQLRAVSGETRRAIELFQASRREGEDPYGFNIYTDASIAFLRNDYKSLVTLRRKLAAVDWPGGDNPNLRVVDGFVRCFGRSYRDVYYECRR